MKIITTKLKYNIKKIASTNKKIDSYKSVNKNLHKKIYIIIYYLVVSIHYWLKFCYNKSFLYIHQVNN